MSEKSSNVAIESPLGRHIEAGERLLSGQDAPGVYLKVVAGRSLSLVTARRNAAQSLIETLAIPRSPGTIGAVGEQAWHWYGPDTWLVNASGRPEGALLNELEERVGRFAAVVDLSHARCVLQLSGTSARSTLAKLCPLDLHAKVFNTGSCANTTMHHMAVHIANTDHAPGFELLVMRGFAVSLCEALLSAAGEFGYAVAY